MQGVFIWDLLDGNTETWGWVAKSWYKVGIICNKCTIKETNVVTKKSYSKAIISSGVD